MVSPAEMLAASFKFSSFNKATELKSRLWFTLLALIVYRAGTYIPVPGVDPAVLGQAFKSHAGGLLGMFDMFSGGALMRMTIFALGVMPYITASIIVQMLSFFMPAFQAMKKEGHSGQMRLNQYSRYLTVLIAIAHSYGMSLFLERMMTGAGAAVVDPGFFFRMSTVITLTGGTMFLMWLGEQITSRGVGNGVSMIIYSGIVANLPGAVLKTIEMGRTAALSAWFILFILVLTVVVLAACAFFERAHRRILVNYPKRQVGNKMYGGEASHMPLRLNTSGVIPPIFAGALLSLPATFGGFTDAQQTGGWLADLMTYMSHGQPLFIAVYAILIVFFSFFYTAIVFNPVETAENLRKYGGFVPGIRPGGNTAEYFDYVLTRLTVVGALYLCAICLLPELLTVTKAIPFYLGGTSLLIVVSVTIDTISRVQSHLIAHQYEGLIKKAKHK